MPFHFIAMPTSETEQFRTGGLDAYGNAPEQLISDGNGNPCRHCLKDISIGKPMLALSYRPFAHLQPYAETGPILLCGESCKRHAESAQMPPSIAQRSEFIMRGYSRDERIVEGTGGVVATSSMKERSAAIFNLPKVTSIHVRSATNNCFFCSIVER